MLDIELRFRRGAFRLEVEARTEAGVLGLYGASGAGKTTLLHLMAGLLRPERGRIVVDDEPLYDHRARVERPPEKRGIGLVFQDGRLFPHMSVRQNLLYGHRRCPRARRRFELAEVIALLELGPLLERRPRSLSGGERQRAALGRAILGGPRLLLMDEPLAGLGPQHREPIFPFLRRVRDALEIPFVYVSHDIGELLRLTQHVLILEEGRSLGCGWFPALCRDPDLLARIGTERVVNAFAVGADDLDERGARRIRLGGSAGPWLFGPEGEPRNGTARTATIAAADVALAPGPVAGISVQNQVAATVTRVTPHGGRALIELDIGAGSPLLAEVSAASASALALGPGTAVRALVKSSAVRLLG